MSALKNIKNVLQVGDIILRYLVHIGLMVLVVFMFRSYQKADTSDLLGRVIAKDLRIFLFAGIDKGIFKLPGADFEPYKPHLPAHGEISFITDKPYKEIRDMVIKKAYWGAQVYLAPLIIDRKPDQDTAIVHCTDALIAEKRLRETGYVWKVKLSDGKGIAVKVGT